MDDLRLLVRRDFRPGARPGDRAGQISGTGRPNGGRPDDRPLLRHAYCRRVYEVRRGSVHPLRRGDRVLLSDRDLRRLGGQRRLQHETVPGACTGGALCGCRRKRSGAAGPIDGQYRLWHQDDRQFPVRTGDRRSGLGPGLRLRVPGAQFAVF
ncbi:hypothetical protein D1872_244160 [compost metagenome]